MSETTFENENESTEARIARVYDLATINEEEVTMEMPCAVTLHVGVLDVITPIEAVNEVMLELSRSGFDGFTFLVTDAADREFYVREGRLVAGPMDDDYLLYEDDEDDE